MKTRKQFVTVSFTNVQRQRRSGFSLLELTVAIAVFMVVGGAAMTLVRRHTVLFTSTQNQSGVNITLRNAVAQLQTDVANAGSGYYPGASMPFWPVGITMSQAVPADLTNCQLTRVYIPTCFDTLTILTADSTMPAASPSADAAGTQPFTYSNAATNVFLTFPSAPVAPATYASWAASFKVGDEVLLVASGTGTPVLAPVTITGPATVVNNTVLQLQVAGLVPDALAIEDNADKLDQNSGMNVFASANAPATTYGPFPADYAIHLNTTRYSVNALNQLTRGPVGAVNPDVVASGIVGFYVEPGVPNGLGTQYKGLVPNSDWTQIRAVKIDLFARPDPATKNDPGVAFTNGYDGGSYQVQGISVVINPRNLSMNN
jgi:type II secretory pathway pseudopilin PulG